MTVDCCICTELLLKANTKVASAPCGHVYHAECLKSWVEKQNNKGICPLCSANFHPSKIIPLHSLDDIQSKSIESIYGFVKNIESKNDDSKKWMELVTDTLNNMSITINEIKRENSELKEKIFTLEKEGFIGNTSDEQLKAKDSVIASLKKEVVDLKAQRMEAAKQMIEIQKQIVELKKYRAPLKNNENSENQQPNQPLSLSFKFDDVADRMILGDM